MHVQLGGCNIKLFVGFFFAKTKTFFSENFILLYIMHLCIVLFFLSLWSFSAQTTHVGNLRILQHAMGRWCVWNTLTCNVLRGTWSVSNTLMRTALRGILILRGLQQNMGIWTVWNTLTRTVVRGSRLLRIMQHRMGIWSVWNTLTRTVVRGIRRRRIVQHWVEKWSVWNTFTNTVET